MMNRLQFLLNKLAEECSELAQDALKTQQYGLDDRKGGVGPSNGERLNAEYNDVLGVAKMLNDEFGNFLVRDPELIQRKIDRINQFLPIAVNAGMVEPEGYRLPSPDEHVDTAAVIAASVIDKRFNQGVSNASWLGTEQRDLIRHQAIAFDRGWGLLTSKEKDSNGFCWDIELVPDLLDYFDSVAPEPELVVEWLRKKLKEEDVA